MNIDRLLLHNHPAPVYSNIPLRLSCEARQWHHRKERIIHCRRCVNALASRSYAVFAGFVIILNGHINMFVFRDNRLDR